MNVFSGRPGLLAGIFSIICVVLTAFCIPALTVSLMITALLGAVFCLVLLLTKAVRPYRCLSLLFLIAVSALSLARGSSFFVRAASEAESLCGEDLRVHATVTERRVSNERYTVYTVQLHSVEGRQTSLLASLECQYNSELQAGYEFILRDADILSVWDFDDAEGNSLIAEKILLIIETESFENCVIISEGNLTSRARIARANSFLSAYMTNGIGGEEGRLAAAMLLGNRDLLDPEIKRNFSRAGLSHYLAVSGMHVSLLTSVFGLVLAKLRIKRGIKNLVMALFALGYLILLGFPVSATRSVIMLLIVFVAHFAGDNSDALNSLGIAAALITAVTPYAIFDGSFVLSFCATLGIVIFMPASEKALRAVTGSRKLDNTKRKGNKLKSFLDLILGAIKRLCLGLFRAVFGVFSALSLTLLPTAVMFGRVSAVGVLANIPSMLVASPLLAFSTLYLIFGRIPYLGVILKTATSYFARAFIGFAEFFSEFEGAVLSLSPSVAVAITVAFTVIILLTVTLKFKKKKVCAFIPVLYPAAILAIAILVPVFNTSPPELTVLSTGKDESILISYEDKAVIVDVSDGSYSRLKSVRELVAKTPATEIEALVLTHYHNKHVYSVTRLMNDEVVRNLYLPMPQNEDDLSVMYALISASESHGCNAYMIKSGEDIPLPGGLHAEFSRPMRLDRSNHPAFWFKIGRENSSLLFVSESAWESTELSEALSAEIAETSVLLLSVHGPVAKTPLLFDASHISEITVFNEDLLPFVCPDDPSWISDNGAELIVGAEIRKYSFGN